MRLIHRIALCAASATAFALLANSAQALQLGTRCSHLPGGLGIADFDPGDGQDLVDAGGQGDPAGTPLVNDVKDDDALTCVLGHIIESPSSYLGAAADVDTFEEWLVELANTASHEIGRLFSLLHEDDIGNDELMDGD